LRILIVTLAASSILACASSPNAGPLGDGMGGAAAIVSVDSALPPKALGVRLDQPSWVTVLLVAPGHSATVVFPRDSATSNRFDAGTVTVPIDIPAVLVQSDSALIRQRRSAASRQDSILRARSRGRTMGGSGSPALMLPIPPQIPTYLLVVTSPQPLVYERVMERTAGMSIPVIESEALNAIGKAVRSTLAAEPRTISAYYRMVELNRP
jgi:hypothetical protein